MPESLKNHIEVAAKILEMEPSEILNKMEIDSVLEHYRVLNIDKETKELMHRTLGVIL